MVTAILILQAFSAVFALAAAICWYYVARVKTPPSLTRIDLADDGFSGEIQQLFRGVAEQGSWNMRAAVCALVSALAQAVVASLSLI
jgi:hypothetical protein